MDPRPGDDQTDVTPEATLALTRELLARSRSTLDAMSRRLAGRDEPHERPAFPPAPER